MVNEMTKVIFAGVLGAGIGSAVTYFYMRKYFADKADSEIASIKRLYSNKKEESKVEEKEDPKEVPENDVMHKEPDDYVSDIYSDFRFGEHYTDYTSYQNKPPVEDTPDNLHPTDDEGESRIYVISSVDYDSDHIHSKKTIYYYADDDIFLDEEDEFECIGDDGKSLGDYKNLVSEGFDVETFKYSDISTIYVRNDDVQIDFEINRMDNYILNREN
jgi:hypothetical protein